MNRDDDMVTSLNPPDPLLARARALQHDIEPTRDLWPEIQAGMNQPARSVSSWLRLATAAAVLIGVSSWTTWQLSEAPLGPADIVQAPYVLPPTLMQAGLAQTRTDLLLALESELDQLSPDDREILAANLRTIDQAMAEINTAIQGNPNSDLLLQLLLSTYTDQLTLMGDMHDLTRSVNERTGI